MRLRLQAKYTLSITALILVVTGVLALTLHYQFRQTAARMTDASVRMLDDTITRELELGGRELVDILSGNVGGAFQREDHDAVQHLLATALHGRHVLYAQAVNGDGRVYQAGAEAATWPAQPPAEMKVRQEIDRLVITAPAEHEGRVLGSVRVAFSFAALQDRRQQMEAVMHMLENTSWREQQVVLSTALAMFLLVGVILAGIMARHLTRPVAALARSARTFADGDLGTPLPPPRGNDEIAELATAFETMRGSLSKTTVSRDFLCRIIDSLNEGFIVTNTGGEIRLANRAVNEMFGYDPDELVGQPFTALVAQPRKFANTPAETKVSECWFLHRDGRMMPVAVSRSLISEGEVGEHVYVITDITERKRLEDELWVYRSRLEQLVVERTKELTAAIQELESFSYSVSHDLHAPLRAINGFGAALREDYQDRLDDAGRDYLNRIELATVRMGQLIDGLLTLTRVVRSELRRVDVDLSALASEISSEMAGEGRRQVTFRIAPQIRAQGDPALMRLLLQNLFSNAWKFTRTRSNALIEFGCEEGEGGDVFFVRDNGAGFDPMFAQGLFQPFHRLHAPDEFPGTGIGLATVQRIVQRHGGRVWAEADPGVGAVFYFTLPSVAQVEERRVSMRAPLS